MADSMSPVTGSGSAGKSVANQDKGHKRAPALLFTLCKVCKKYTAHVQLWVFESDQIHTVKNS